MPQTKLQQTSQEGQMMVQAMVYAHFARVFLQVSLTAAGNSPHNNPKTLKNTESGDTPRRMARSLAGLASPPGIFAPGHRMVRGLLQRVHQEAEEE